LTSDLALAPVLIVEKTVTWRGQVWALDADIEPALTKSTTPWSLESSGACLIGGRCVALTIEA